MPVVAILPAAALLAGATVGIAAPLPPACWLTVLILSWLASIAGFVWRASAFTLFACLLGFAAAAAALAQRATREALEPRILGQSAPYRVDTVGTAAIPLELEAQIVGDAVTTEFGAAFTVDVNRIRLPHQPALPEQPALATPHALAERQASPEQRSLPRQHTSDRDAGPEWHDSAGRVRVTISGAHVGEHLQDWRGGRSIRASVLLNTPLPFRNFGTVDQEQRLALAGIRLFGAVKSATQIEVIASASPWQEASASAREYVRRAVAHDIARWDPRSAAIVTAILIGDRTGLDAQTESRLQRAGTYHVIAISGGNIAILVTLATTLLRLARASPRLRAALAILVVAIYATIVGNGASVARATLGAVVYLLAHALDHRSAAINILGVAAAIIIVLAPLEAIDPAFWLTCLATLAILVCAERIQTHLINAITTRMPRLTTRAVRWLEPPLALFAATVAAEAWLLPITAYAFSQMTLAGLALNFAAIPLMAIAQITGLIVVAIAATAAATASVITAIAAVTSAGAAGAAAAAAAATKWLTPIASAAGYLSHLAAYALVESARLVDAFPHAAMRLAPPPLWLVIATEVFGIVTSSLLINRDRAGSGSFRNLGRLAFACFAAWSCALLTIASAPSWPTTASPAALTTIHAAGHAPCAAPPPPPPARVATSATLATSATSTATGWLRMTALDVAQGDATLLRFPSGETLMVDAGGSVTGTYDIGGRIVSPALWALGLRRLHTLALTHGDRDHIGGASAIVTDFTPREIWEGVPVIGHPLLTALRAQTQASASGEGRGALWRTVRLGDHRILAGDVHLHVWNPPAPEWERRRVRNDDSIVLEIVYGRVSIILPGDIGPDVERALAAAPFASPPAPAASPASPAPAPAAPPTMLRILKAPHHGSGRSSTSAFLNAVAPGIAIISAGRGNTFGHPAPAALDRYRQQGTAIFRTDRDGAIQLDTDGRDIFITTCTGRTAHFTAPLAP